MSLYILCAANKSNKEAWTSILNVIYFDDETKKFYINYPTPAQMHNSDIEWTRHPTESNFNDALINRLLADTPENKTPRLLLSVEESKGSFIVKEVHFLSQHKKINSKQLEGFEDLEKFKKHITENADARVVASGKRKRDENTPPDLSGDGDVKRPRMSTNRKPTEEATPLMTWASEVIKFIENYAFIFVKTKDNKEPKQDELNEPLRIYPEKTGYFLRSIGNQGKLMPKAIIKMVDFLKGLINKKAAKVSLAELEIYKEFIQYARNRANAFETYSTGLSPKEEKSKDSCNNNAIFYRSLSEGMTYKAIPEEFVESISFRPGFSKTRG